MSTLEELKEYLVGDGGYLLNPDSNGKTVMLSGAWGSGKTHFWQNEIEDDLTEELKEKNKACVYVSLYGKDNIEAIKNEILFKAYESIKDENKIAKRAISAFGFGSRLLSVSVGGVRANTGAVGDVVESFFESKKIDEAELFLADGGLICLDDFERKSKHIDLNDLFGFIAQLAIDMNCKVVIILNSDVFEGEEASVFKTVKEKTVNKFFYFKPEIEELFKSIYESNKKYKVLDDYRDEILKAIEEAEELNARIYIQVLDNCLEWTKKEYDSRFLRPLIFSTVYFIKTHYIMSYVHIDYDGHMEYYSINHAPRDIFPQTIISFLNQLSIEEQIGTTQDSEGFTMEYTLGNESGYLKRLKEKSFDSIYSSMESDFLDNKKYSETAQKNLIDFLYDYENEIYEFWKYGYKLYFFNDIDKDTYGVMSKFIKSGILPKKDKESSS